MSFLDMRCSMLHANMQFVAFASTVCLLLAVSGSGEQQPGEPVSRAAGQRVGVLPVLMEGDGTDKVKQKRFSDQIDTSLGRTGFVLVPIDAGCAATCMTERAQAEQLRGFVRPTIRIHGRDYEIRIEMVGVHGNTAANVAETCEICGLDEVVTAIDAAIVKLVHRVHVLESAPGSIDVITRPPGAILEIDGQRMGATPVSVPVEPGAHVVRVHKRGFMARAERVEVHAAANERLVLELVAVAKNRASRLQAWGAATLAVGVAMLATGIALVALDERPYRQRCTGDDIDPYGNCRLRYNTLAGGVVTTVVAAGLVSAGVAMLVTSRDRDRAKKMAWSPLGLTVRY